MENKREVYLPTKQRGKILKKVRELIEACFYEEILNPRYTIAQWAEREGLNIRFIKRDFDEESFLIWGSLYREGREFSVFVNEAYGERDRNVIYAYMLAHIGLGYFKDDYLTIYRPYSFKNWVPIKRHHRCWFFALNYLVPKIEFMRLMRQQLIMNQSKAVGVSPLILTYFTDHFQVPQYLIEEQFAYIQVRGLWNEIIKNQVEIKALTNWQ